jgi:hypothetical protein
MVVLIIASHDPELLGTKVILLPHNCLKGFLCHFCLLYNQFSSSHKEEEEE